MNDTVKLILVAGGAWLLWNWYANSQAVAATATPATVSGTTPPVVSVPITTPVTPIVSTTPAPITSLPSVPVTVAPIATPVTPQAAASAWSQAIQVMKSQAGTDSANWDQWSYYWQNSPTFAGAPFGFGVFGSISPSMFGSVLNGASDTSLTTAEQFAANLQSVVNSLGLGQMFMPVSRRAGGRPMQRRAMRGAYR